MPVEGEAMGGGCILYAAWHRNDAPHLCSYATCKSKSHGLA